ncbi:DNA-binding LacI/PurR family transcriptional regulator [Clavibacter sp. B3I6]|uniref:LacI family DNA-binding transcriptional regulator n=1 Tax=Clavibacter sp. B3I6 TaxID=3042268 RepID=UPI00277D3529|nr:substrate-binding domain-containing protein [Clavibacter sp. B3I6]MDQ0744494.1 DNA-binding LacI/PurR family transcriptional regulator [Clavibacter sp. B3I6]
MTVTEPAAPSDPRGAEAPADCASVGLVVVRPPGSFGLDPFWGELLGGMEEALDRADRTVLLQIVADRDEEAATYRRWAAGRTIVGVLVGDIVADDPRGALLDELGMPAVMLGDVDDPAHTVVQVDDFGAMRAAVEHLVDLGHRRIARVAGRPQLLHSQARSRAFAATTAAAGITGRSVDGDYTPVSGAELTRLLLEAAEPPTAIVYDNDVMAAAGLEVAVARGLDVPGDLSLLAWDDSAICRLAHPPLSAMRREVHDLGRIAAAAVLDAVAGRGRTVVHVSDATLVVRGTTAPPRPPAA